MPFLSGSRTGSETFSVFPVLTGIFSLLLLLQLILIIYIFLEKYLLHWDLLIFFIVLCRATFYDLNNSLYFLISRDMCLDFLFSWLVLLDVFLSPYCIELFKEKFLDFDMSSNGLPSCAIVKNPSVNAEDTRDLGLMPGSGRSSAVGSVNPPQYSCWENSMDGEPGGL